ncbi:MAG: murein hydrolase activator EnvC family protein [Suipraeoptans sp.]
MIKGKKMITILLSLTLAFTMFITAGATEISDAEQKARELEEQKNSAAAEKAQLSNQLDTILSEMEETKNAIAIKLIEIADKEVELSIAKVTEREQYEAMKLRIKYMYETGSSQFLEILASAESFSDLINSAEYVQNVSTYDRDMLIEFQNTVKEVEKQEADLKTQHTELEEMEASLAVQQSNVEEMVAQKGQEINALDTALSAQNQLIADLKQAAEDAARRAAEAAAAAASTASSTPVYGTGGASVVTGSGQFSHPLPGSRVTSGFGYRTNPIYGGQEFHKGIDYAAPSGTPIYAAEAGTVTVSGYGPSTGNWIAINHGNGLLTYYFHCSALYVNVGATVTRGQNIAAVGSTGDSTGPHLHFQVMQNGSAVNPLYYL